MTQLSEVPEEQLCWRLWTDTHTMDWYLSGIEMLDVSQHRLHPLSRTEYPTGDDENFVDIPVGQSVIEGREQSDTWRCRHQSIDPIFGCLQSFISRRHHLLRP